MNYNICIIQPSGYIHSAAFFELAELIGYGLLDLGHSVAINFNQISADAKNIIIGCHLLASKPTEDVPRSSIVVNTEQIFSDQTPWNNKIFEWVSAFETWDYSERNIIKLREMGAKTPKLLRIGFHEKLVRIEKAPEQDIDVLFYGSITERRQKVIDELKIQGFNIKAVFGIYGEERDRLIARSKVVLNLHHYESQIFEIVRVFYLMTNSKAVVSEIGDNTAIDLAYLEGIFPSNYVDIVQSCKELVANTTLRQQIEARALATIALLPQSKLLAPLLDGN
jgi:hypothetical protein